MKNMFLFLSLLLIAGISYAQAPFSGGKGDGYARTSLQGVALAIAPAAPVADSYLYPQPARTGESVYLRFSTPPSYSLQLSIWDSQGRECIRSLLQADDALPIQQLSPGIYVLRVRTQTGEAYHKLLLR